MHVSFEGDEDAARSALVELDPYAPAAGASGPEPDGATLAMSVLPAGGRHRLRELQLLAEDGLVTGYDGERLWLLDAGVGCSVPPLEWDGVADVRLERGFGVGRAFRSVVRPALQLAVARRGGVAIHAASVEIDGRAVLVAGWSESGKTETALALVEDGASFFSDKWTVVTDDGRAAAFPIGVGVRGWVLRYLPRLREGLPLAARMQLRGAAVGGVITGPLRRWHGGGRVGQLAADVARRSVALADRAGLRPSQIRQIYGDRADPARRLPVGLVAVLRTSPADAVSVDAGDPERLSTRLAVSAVAERSSYLDLQRRAAYAEARRFDVASVQERDREAIHALLASTRTVEVTAPFPADPRRVAVAIAGSL